MLLMAVGGGLGSFENAGWAGVAVSAAAALVGWVGWAAITCFVGTRLLPGPDTSSDMGELLRTIGFSSAPGILACLGVIPGLNPWLYHRSRCMASGRDGRGRASGSRLHEHLACNRGLPHRLSHLGDPAGSFFSIDGPLADLTHEPLPRVSYCAKSQPVWNVSDSEILEAGMVAALGPPRTC